MQETVTALEVVGKYLDCPDTYFALRSVCRGLYSRMAPLCPMTLRTSVNHYKDRIRDPNYSKWVKVAALGENADAVKFLDEAVTCPGRILLIDSVLGLITVNELASASHHALNSLIEASLTGEVELENYATLVAACAVKPSFFTSIKKPLRFIGPVVRYLPSLDAGKGVSW